MTAKMMLSAVLYEDLLQRFVVLFFIYFNFISDRYGVKLTDFWRKVKSLISISLKYDVENILDLRFSQQCVVVFLAKFANSGYKSVILAGVIDSDNRFCLLCCIFPPCSFVSEDNVWRTVCHQCLDYFH